MLVLKAADLLIIGLLSVAGLALGALIFTQTHGNDHERI